MTPFPYRHKGEIFYVILSTFFGALLISISLLFLILLPDTDSVDPILLDTISVILLFPIFGMTYRRFRQSHAREQFLRVTPDQFPDIYAHLEQASAHFKLPQTPPAYLVLSPSVNPCAEDYGARPDVWIGTDFYAGCRENNTPEALEYMVAHQVAHIAAHHGTSLWYTLCGPMLHTPFVKAFLSRSMEYSADAGAASICPEGAVRALQLCAVGKDNFVHANAATQLSDTRHAQGFYGRIAYLLSDHPSATRRMRALVNKKLIASPLPDAFAPTDTTT